MDKTERSYNMKKLFACLILLSLCFIVYFNSLEGQFISDDVEAILTNPNVNNINTVSIQGIVSPLIHQRFGNNPFPYHLASLILHSINTILVFFLLLTFFNEIPAFVGASIFAVNPIHTEAVSWISGQGYEWLALFVLMTILMYRKAIQ